MQWSIYQTRTKLILRCITFIVSLCISIQKANYSIYWELFQTPVLYTTTMQKIWVIRHKFISLYWLKSLTVQCPLLRAHQRAQLQRFVYPRQKLKVLGTSHLPAHSVLKNAADVQGWLDIYRRYISLIYIERQLVVTLSSRVLYASSVIERSVLPLLEHGTGFRPN